MSEMLVLFIILLIVLPLITWRREGIKQALLLFIGLIGLILFIMRDYVHISLAIIGIITVIVVIVIGVVLHFKKK